MDQTRIRAVASTRNSITVSWDAGEESANGDAEKFVLEMKDRILGWTTVYSGYKREIEIKCLKPGECFQFRLKEISPSSGETDWTESVFAATKDEAIPLAHLFRAVQNSQPVNTKKIIAQRPSILNTPNKFNQTPLQLSVSNNDTNMVGVLLNNGADINGPETGSWRTPLMIAAFRGYLDMVKILIEKGSRWEDRDRNEMTALHYAADNSHLDIVTFAVEDGAQINAKDIFGWTPVMRAAFWFGTDLAEVFTDGGAVGKCSQAFTRYCGQSCLHWNVRVSEDRIPPIRYPPSLSVKQLVCSKSDVLDSPRDSQQSWIIEYLLENGSDVNETDNNDQTLLMHAILSERPDIAKLVLSKNADVSVRNSNGHTARDIAAASPNKEIRKMCALLGGAGTDSKKKTRRNRRTGKDVAQ